MTKKVNDKLHDWDDRFEEILAENEGQISPGHQREVKELTWESIEHAIKRAEGWGMDPAKWKEEDKDG